MDNQKFYVFIQTAVNNGEKLNIQNGFREYFIFEPFLGNQ